MRFAKRIVRLLARKPYSFPQLILANLPKKSNIIFLFVGFTGKLSVKRRNRTG